MVLHISIVGINVASVVIESLLFGVFMLLSVTSSYLLIAKERRSDRPKNKMAALTTPLILASITLVTTVTVHWVLSIVRVVEAFVHFNGGNTPREYYEDQSRTLFVVSTAFIIVTLIAGDSVMLYRLRTVFKYNRSTVVFPLCCLFGFIACGIGTIFQFSKFSTNKNMFLAAIGTVFTFITNVYCSSFIASKIYRINSAATNYAGQSLKSITGIIIESAALYTSWTIMFMAAFLAGSNLVYLFADTIPVITGISFMLINVRIGLGWAVEVVRSGERSTTGHSISVRPTPASRSHIDERRSGTGSYQLRSLAVHIERTVIKESEVDTKTMDDSLGAHESLSDRSSTKPVTLDSPRPSYI